MSTEDLPQIYLVTPSVIDLDFYPDQLARVLDSVEIACLRLGLASIDEDHISRAADALRDIAHARDIMLVVERHALLVERLGLDGVHLMDGGRNLRQLRKDLGEDAILGAYCNTSRHDGLTAGEAGADYVSFGPVAASALGDGVQVDPELLSWWSEMIEVPVVAEGGLTADSIRSLANKVDFFAIGAEIWTQDDPLAQLQMLAAARNG
ncbi:thiamine phosphate synthase [Planktomarina sp.]|jgi:thiamine-phosphate pyrophosphorylase|nr:thiamine phosphate synthase [Planktomarina sp.]MDB4841578.1 thiamine phosphate synthase [Planktomarina sp.]